MFPKAALSNTGIPRVNVASSDPDDEQPEVDISDEEFLQFDTSGVPVIITLTRVKFTFPTSLFFSIETNHFLASDYVLQFVLQVGKHYIVDATAEEESQMSSAVSMSINRKGHVCGLTKRGGTGLDPSIILDMISVAKHLSEELMNKLDSEIAAAEADEES